MEPAQRTGRTHHPHTQHTPSTALLVEAHGTQGFKEELLGGNSTGKALTILPSWPFCMGSDAGLPHVSSMYDSGASLISRNGSETTTHIATWPHVYTCHGWCHSGPTLAYSGKGTQDRRCETMVLHDFHLGRTQQTSFGASLIPTSNRTTSEVQVQDPLPNSCTAGTFLNVIKLP